MAAIPRPTHKRRAVPIKGLNLSQARAKTRQATVPPTTKPTMAATTWTIIPRSAPTRGIQERSCTMGEKSRKKPNMHKKMAQGLMHEPSLATASSLCSSILSAVVSVSLIMKTTSSNRVSMQQLTHLQM